MARKPISKRVRFAIFERDQYTCQYCGKQPPDVVLELDHIQPHSKGGSDEPLNLTTSCKDCNLGKSDRELGKFPPSQDAYMERLRIQQERVELIYYTYEVQWYQEQKQELIGLLQKLWSKSLNTKWVPRGHVILGWSFKYKPNVIVAAIDATARACSCGTFSRPERNGPSPQDVIRYASACMRNMARDGTPLDTLSNDDGSNITSPPNSQSSEALQ